MFLQLSESLSLSYTALGDIKGSEPVIFLHGIMGNKKNLSSFVEQFLTAHPKYSALIFDLRNHGMSSKHVQPFTVLACARDIVQALKTLEVFPKKIIGHSFGGKVAIFLAKLQPKVEQVWLLDSSPGQVLKKKPLDKTKDLSAMEIIDILSRIQFPVASRRDLVKKMLAAGANDRVSLWMTTNLKALDDGLYLTFVPDEIRQMLLDFIELDLWSELFLLRQKIDIHVVKAEYGQRLNDVDEKQLKKMTGNKGYFHNLKDAGHFLHVDNPKGLLALMNPYF